jgi:hypothetical protein
MSSLKEMLSKQKDLRMKVDKATFEECEHSILADLSSVMKYFLDRKERETGRANQVLTYKRRHYTTGLKEVSSRIDQQLSITDVPDADNGALYANRFTAKLMEKVDTGPTSIVYSLLVLDLARPPSYQVIESLLRIASDLLHNNSSAAMLVQMPVQYAGQEYSALLKHRRRIEDRLMFHKIIIEKDISMTYDVPGGGRPLGSIAKLCWSQEYAKTSCWVHSEAAKGKIEGIPVQRERDMRTMSLGASMVPQDPWKLSPGDRIQQLGEAGTTMLLNALVTGVGINNADKVIIVDLRPCINAQWLKTCHLGQLDWSSNVTSVYGFPAYCGLDIEDPAVSSTIRTDATELLISSWWDTCPEAGSKEPTDLAASIVKPVLSFMTWDATSGKSTLATKLSGRS